MRIVKYDPLREIDRFFGEPFVWPFPTVQRINGPATDMYQTDKDLIVEIQMPKVDPSRVKIAVDDGMLKVEVADESGKEEENRNYFYQEIRRGAFTRVLSLPVPVKEDEAKATFENGVLKIALPKVEAKKPKEVKIEIK